MYKGNMKRLMTILEIKHYDKNKNVIWEAYNIPNVVHDEGEKFFLQALFRTDDNQVPVNYYCGLDNRSSPGFSDTFMNVEGEPTTFEYERQEINSSLGFSISLNEFNVFQATTGVLSFSATGGRWGPIKNVFLTTSFDNTGVLIATSSLDGTHYVDDGQALSLRFALTLRDATNATFTDET